MSSLGAPFCRGVEPFLANLQALLNECAVQGVSHFDAVVSAQAVFDDVNGYQIYVPFIGDDCTRHIGELQLAINKVKIVLQAIPGASTNVPRPDAVPPNEYAIPTWIKVVAVGGLALYGLTVIRSFVPRRRRLAGRSRR